MFVDDTLIFCEVNSDRLRYLSWVFIWFEALFGLKVNLDKNEVIHVGGVENMEELAVGLGCGVGKLSTSFMGLPLGASFKSLRMWDVVEEIFRKKLFMWK